MFSFPGSSPGDHVDFPTHEMHKPLCLLSFLQPIMISCVSVFVTTLTALNSDGQLFYRMFPNLGVLDVFLWAVRLWWFGKNTQKWLLIASSQGMMLIWFTGDATSEPLIRVVSARFLHSRVTFFTFPFIVFRYNNVTF